MRYLSKLVVFFLTLVAVAFLAERPSKPGFDRNGLPHGDFAESREDGTLFCVTTFSHGSWTQKKIFDENGNVVEHITQ